MADTQQVLPTESVDRVRDIIFGPKMRDYEQRLEAIMRDLSRLQEEIDRLNEQLAARDATQTKNLQALRQELRQTEGTLRSEQKVEVGRLGAQTSEQAAGLNTDLQNLRHALAQTQADLQADFQARLNELGNQLSEQDTTQNSSLQTLRQELRKADADLREEVRQLAQRLTQNKAERSVLGDLFIELGNHVKSGDSFADMLKTLDRAS